MKNYKIANKKRFTVALICMAMILLVAVGGTLAYLAATGNTITNKFKPSQVSTYVNETVTGSEKTEISITNTGDTSAFIRVAIIQNWVDDDGNVIPGDVPALPALGQDSDWMIGSDGFYYYTEEVPAGGDTAELFPGKAISEGSATKPDADAHLQVTILADGIQSKGTNSSGVKAVKNAWNVDL